MKFKEGDRVRRIKSTAETSVPIDSIGIVKHYWTTDAPRMVTCNWRQPENPMQSPSYYVPERDIELYEERFAAFEMPIPLFFLQQEEQDEEVRAPKVRRRVKETC